MKDWNPIRLPIRLQCKNDIDVPYHREMRKSKTEVQRQYISSTVRKPRCFQPNRAEETRTTCTYPHHRPTSRQSLPSRPGPPHHPQKIPVENRADVRIGIPAPFQNTLDALQVGDGVEIAGALFFAESAVEIAADADVMGVPGELADVVDVIGDVGDFDSGGFGSGGAAGPAGDHHPGVEDGAEDGVALDEEPDLFVAELTRVVDEGAAVRVARPDGTGINVEGFEKGIVAEVGDVEDDPELVHFADEFGSAGTQAANLIVSHRVASGAVV